MPLMITGGMRSRAAMEAALATGGMDVIGLGRPMCVDTDICHKLLAGQESKARSYEWEMTFDRAVLGPDVPPEIEWFANLTSPATQRAYQNAIKDFMGFTGIQKPEEFRTVTRAHVIAWRDDLINRARSGSTIRHRLAALASLYDYLCEQNAVTHNPVKGVQRPKVDGNEGRTQALGDHQARKLLDAPDGSSLRLKRDRAILATLLYHALRRDELCRLKVKDFKHERRGVAHLKVSGKGGKTRYVPLHPAVVRLH